MNIAWEIYSLNDWIWLPNFLKVIMKIVGVVCLSLCLWANAETGGFTKSDSERLDALFYGVFRNPTPQVQVHWFGSTEYQFFLIEIINQVQSKMTHHQIRLKHQRFKLNQWIYIFNDLYYFVIWILFYVVWFIYICSSVLHYFQKVYSLGRPCVERTLAGLDNAVLDSTYTYLYRNSECYNNSLTESSRTEQQAKYKSCLETLPPKPEENMSKVNLIHNTELLNY